MWLEQGSESVKFDVICLKLWSVVSRSFLLNSLLFFTAEDIDFTLNVTKLNERTECVTKKKKFQKKTERISNALCNTILHIVTQHQYYQFSALNILKKHSHETLAK